MELEEGEAGCINLSIHEILAIAGGTPLPSSHPCPLPLCPCSRLFAFPSLIPGDPEGDTT